ncbi:MAG: hypothetical protein GEU80_02725 [Dehalococcoidia bacterium]|nr:hypothetical protein [Dehalococcoidia bacterium]
MTETHAPRPLDLVALVTFDEDVRENLAVTREALGGPPAAPKPVGVAIEQWLHLGRQMWISLRGRQVQGIATARELSARSAWQIDALIDADDEATEGEPGRVLNDLLRQAILAAQAARVTHILLRTRSDAPAVSEALRTGFLRASEERLWHGDPAALASLEGGAAVEVRPRRPQDTFALFQLYGRAVPMEARQALAMTLEEWEAVRERRWCARGGIDLVASEQGRLTGALRGARDEGVAQLELLVEPGHEAAGATLLAEASEHLEGAARLLALVARSAGATEHLLRNAGMEPTGDYVLLSRRIARPVREEARRRRGIAIPTRG